MQTTVEIWAIKTESNEYIKTCEMCDKGFLILKKESHPVLGNVFVQYLSKIFVGIGFMGAPVRVFKERDVEVITATTTIY